MTTANLGTVQVTISGKDVGLGQVMQAASQAMQQAAQGAQILVQNLDRQQAIQERAKAASLAYISAIVKQRGAVGQLDSAMGILTKNSLQFAGETITAARYSALYQTTLQASRQAAIDLAAAQAKASLGTESFGDALDKLVVELNNTDNTTSQYITTLNKVNDLAKQHITVLNKLAQEEEKAKQKVQQGAVATLQKAQADARALAAAKNHVKAIHDLQNSLNTLEQEFGDVITKTIQWSNAQAQLARYQKQTDSDSRRLNGSLFALVKGLNSYVGAAYALNAVFSNIGAVITAGNELEKITSTVEALSKSQSRFNDIMQAARSQQELYGGSLQENLDDLSGFIYISNQTGIAVERLANTARRLAIIDPAQGMKGASVALKEFFSGDIQSLSRRFEISRTSLNSIKALGSEIEKLKGLDALLEDMGIGMQILDQKTQLTATTYDKLAGSFQDAIAAFGGFVAEGYQDVADANTDFFKSVTVFFTDLTEQMKQAEEAVRSSSTNIATALLESSASSKDYAQALLDADLASIGTGGQVVVKNKALTLSQYQVAEAFKATGVSAKEAIDYVVKYKSLIESLKRTDAATSAALIISANRVINSNNNLTPSVMRYVDAVKQKKMTAEEAIQAINYLGYAEHLHQQELQASNQEIQKNIKSIGELITVAKTNAAETVVATAETALLSEAQNALNSIAELAASGLLTTAEAAAIMGTQFGVTTVDANILIGALEKIRNWRGNAQITAMLAKGTIGTGDLLQVSQNFQDLGIDADYQDIADALKNYGVESQKAAEAQAKAAEDAAKAVEDAAKAQADYEFSLLNTADKITSLNTKLKGLTTSNKEYWTTLGQIKQLEQQLAQERSGTGGGGTATKEEQVTELEKLVYELSDIRTEFYSDMEDAEKEYQQNVLDIQKEFARKQKEAEQTNERDKRRSRASFYQSLTDVEGIDVTTFSAQYEQIFLEAQRIAQEGKAALSKEFLDLRQDQLSEMIDLEKEMADIRTDKDLPETTKQAKLEYLQGIKKLLEDAQAEELKQLMEGGDKNQTELADQLAEEAKQYGEQTQKIAIAAKDQADAKITAAERSKKIIGEENELLQKQLDIYYDMYRLLGRETANRIVGITTESVPPALAPGAPTAPAATEYTVPELKIDTPSVTIQAPQPSAVAPSNATPTAVTSMQALSEVHDRVLTATLQTIGARLESKLAEVITAVYDSAGSTVDAIGKIRIPAPQIVSR